MLRPVVPMFGLPIYAIDGKIGTFFDIYFNDSAWNIELMVIEVTDFLFDRHVLVSPSSFFIDADGALHVRLTMGQVRRRPDYDGDGSVPERFGDNGGMPLSQLSDDAMEESLFPHLRSMRTLLAHQCAIHGRDAETVEDFIVDDSTWRVEHLVSGQGGFPCQEGKRKVPVAQIGKIDLREAVIYTKLSQEMPRSGEAPVAEDLTRTGAYASESRK